MRKARWPAPSAGGYICNECIELCVEIQSENAHDDGGNAVLRIARAAEGGTTELLTFGPLSDLKENKRWLRQCRHCGTWNVGAGEGRCLYCADQVTPLR